MSYSRRERNFLRMLNITLVSIFLVVFAGSFVRTTGAGMGCPDWPKCYGKLIPPTSENELPENYKEIYTEKGYTDVRFNARKTWTEYINRLIGALAGLFIVLTAFFAYRLGKENRKIFYYILLGLLIILMQAWLGKLVVTSNLADKMISLHMALVVVLFFFLFNAKTYLVQKKQKRPILSKKHFRILVFAFILSLVQLFLGTRVRNEIDLLSYKYDYGLRDLWISSLSYIVYIHRSLSLLILGVNGYLVYSFLKQRQFFSAHRSSILVIGLTIVISIIIGASLYYFDVPWFLQPFHLLIGLAIIAFQYDLLSYTLISPKND